VANAKLVAALKAGGERWDNFIRQQQAGISEQAM
jgi:hypothetical protein